jgi:membrane protein
MRLANRLGAGFAGRVFGTVSALGSRAATAARDSIRDRDWKALLARAWPALGDAARLAVYAAGRFYRDRCPQVAASLTYTTLLSMVPLLTIAFAILAAFPAFEGIREQAQAMLFENMVPEVGDKVAETLKGFTRNAGKMTAVGVVFVAVTSILTLNTIETVFNTIWRVGQPRPIVVRVLAFWAMLTMGPLLFGASLSLSSYLFALQHSLSLAWWGRALIQIASLAPFLLSMVGFILLFQVVPNFPVARRNAIAGGVMTAVLFELLKRGFGLYVSKFAAYQAVYGALATVPIFMLWVYLCWMVVLFGAEVTASLPEWRAGRGFAKSISTPGRKLAVALMLLGAIHHRAREGKVFRDRHLLEKVPGGSDLLGDVLGRLLRAEFVARGERGTWLLARDLEVTTLNDLMAALELVLDPNDLGGERGAWHDRVDALLAENARHGRNVFGVTLKQLLAEAPAKA